MQVGGGGGNRTRVRKGSNRSFYTLSQLVFLSHRPSTERQMNDRPAPNFRPAARGVTTRLSRICVASSDRLGQAIRETSRSVKPRKLAVSCQLLLVHCLARSGTSTCYFRLCLPVESSSPPESTASIHNTAAAAVKPGGGTTPYFPVIVRIFSTAVTIDRSNACLRFLLRRIRL